MRRFLFPILIAALAFVSCKKETAQVQDEEDPLLDNAITLIDGSSSECRIVFASDANASALKIQEKVMQATGVKLSVMEYGASLPKKAIIVGNTPGSESVSLLSEIKEYGYAVAVRNSSLLLVWKGEGYADKALEKFRSEILGNASYCHRERLQVPQNYHRVIDSYEPKPGPDPDPDPEPVKDPTIKDLLDANMKVTLDYKYIGNAPRCGDCYVAQGAASDGKYVYFVLRDNTDTKAIVLKYTLDPFKYSSQSQIFNGGHCNDLTYQDHSKELILAHGQNQGKILTRIDAETLKVLGDVNITVGSGAITYDKTLDRYAISQGGTTLYVADRNFKVLNSYKRLDNTGYTAQGMGSDDHYIYFPMSNGKVDNLLVTYDWKGNHVTDLMLKIAKESESMFCVNDKYYVCFYDSANSQKGAALYEVFPKK